MAKSCWAFFLSEEGGGGQSRRKDLLAPNSAPDFSGAALWMERSIKKRQPRFGGGKGNIGPIRSMYARRIEQVGVSFAMKGEEG